MHDCFSAPLLCFYYQHLKLDAPNTYVRLIFQMYKAQSPKASGSPKAVNFFDHFPSNFLRPYVIADSRPDEDTIFRRVKALNCEWLMRPRVAASEFADTIRDVATGGGVGGVTPPQRTQKVQFR